MSWKSKKNICVTDILFFPCSWLLLSVYTFLYIMFFSRCVRFTPQHPNVPGTQKNYKPKGRVNKNRVTSIVIRRKETYKLEDKSTFEYSYTAAALRNNKQRPSVIKFKEDIEYFSTRPWYYPINFRQRKVSNEQSWP